MLPGRQQRAVRLAVHRIDTAELPGLLEQLRWPGSPDAVMSVIADTEDLTQPGSVLSLDAAASGISPRVGLELFRSVERARVDHAGWQPMINRLADRSCCVPAKAEGLRAWPRAERLLGPGGVYRLHLTISHIKVSFPGFAPRLSASHVPIRRPPRLGEHTSELLGTELALDDAQIDALRDAGVIGGPPPSD